MTEFAPLPGIVLDELLSCVRVEFDKYGGLVSLALPPNRQLSNLLADCGGRNLPHDADEVGRQLEEAAWKALPHWKLAHLQAERKRSSAGSGGPPVGVSGGGVPSSSGNPKVASQLPQSCAERVAGRGCAGHNAPDAMRICTKHNVPCATLVCAGHNAPDATPPRARSKFFGGGDVPRETNAGTGAISNVMWETRIATMKMPELQRLVKLNGLVAEPHPTNNGLTCMRSRNALYAAMRKGVVLKDG